MNGIPDEIRAIPKHYEELSEKELQHTLRVNMLNDYVDGTNQYASIEADDILRWMKEESLFYPDKFAQLGLDIDTLNRLYDADLVSEAVAIRIDELLEEESEETHRQFMNMLEVARSIDTQFSTDYANALYQGVYGIDAPAVNTATTTVTVAPELEPQPERTLDEELGIDTFDDTPDDAEFDDMDDMDDSLLMDDFDDVSFDDFDDIPEFVDDDELEL